MSLSAAISSVLALDRQRARRESERVQAEENERRTSIEATTDNSEQDLESGAPDSSTAAPVQSHNSADGLNVNSRNRLISSSERDSRNDEGTEELNAEADESAENFVDEEERAPDDYAAHVARSNTMTLAELEEERELSRRRSSACVLLAVFVLFRLWIECLQKRDPTLLLLCLLGTSWTARWIRFNREREEELDRRIEAYLQTNNNTAEVDRNEFARLSFQAQLALAIMESQRHMREGGFGRPDGVDESRQLGVSEESKALWKKFQWKSPDAAGSGGVLCRKGEYGAVPTKGCDSHCSVCLSEYEDCDMLTQLPCGHVYHDECIQAWTQNHTKCPLCNYDLASPPSEM